MNLDELARADEQAQILAQNLVMVCRKIAKHFKPDSDAEDIQDLAIEKVKQANDMLEELIPR